MALTVLLGGARSGKSTLAMERAHAFDGPVVFVATGEARDAEMAERIDRHRLERPSDWATVEAPLDLVGALSAVDSRACVIVDCLSLWVANLLEARRDERDLHAIAEAAARLAADRDAETIAVSNEVGMGVVPANELGRRYRDALGRVNAIWVDAASRAALVVAGRVIRLEALDVG
jgi:adenosylcobinamide kinase/adenosylcobinamide-phosphate guanylyltransferase